MSKTTYMLSENDEGGSTFSTLSTDVSDFIILVAIGIFKFFCSPFLEVSESDKSGLSEIVGSMEISISLVTDCVLSASSVDEFLINNSLPIVVDVWISDTPVIDAIGISSVIGNCSTSFNFFSEISVCSMHVLSKRSNTFFINSYPVLRYFQSHAYYCVKLLSQSHRPHYI
ncbi:hypothetical protein PUN28_014757 [Cardiocondyla obscurior]|uniref:Uncharacterized protein n=1 Tax=Cardiocondyla obscurior TaxID=286306 RepID=A0AAW2EYC9_9HYME